MISGVALAQTSCGGQAKPDLSCPEGYSVMCISSGGDHWGCGKEGSYNSVIEVQGTIIEPEKTEEARAVEVSGSGSAETTGVKTTTQVTSETAIGTKDNDPNAESEKVLPTVNKGTDDDSDGSNERVLPTVNKKTTAKVEVRGWDPEKKELIEAEVQTQVENDSAIKSVEITQDNVNLKYATKAKLFAFIPITMNVDVSSSSEGRVKVKFPWYRFMVKTDYAKSAEILNYIFQNNESDFEFLRTKGSAEAQLEIFIIIKNAMHEMSKSIIQNIKA